MQGGGTARHGRCHTCEALASIGGRCATPPRARGGTPPEGRAAPGRTTDGPTVAPAEPQGKPRDGPREKPKQTAHREAATPGRDARPGHGSRATTEPTKGRPRRPTPKKGREKGPGGTPGPRAAGEPPRDAKRGPHRAATRATARGGTISNGGGGRATEPARAASRRPTREPHRRQAGGDAGGDGGGPERRAGQRHARRTTDPGHPASRATRGKPPGANRAEGAPNGTRPEYRVGPELATGGDGERPRNAPRADGGKGPRPKVQAWTISARE